VDEAHAGEALDGGVGGEVVLDLLEGEGEDGVGARRGVVHLGGGGGAVHVAGLHEALDVLVAADLLVGEVLHVDAVLLALADLEVGGLAAGAGGEEVLDVLVVDLEVGDVDVVGDAAVLLGLDALEEAAAGAGDEAGLVEGAHHGVGLAGAGLAVGEDAGVVAIEVVVEKLLAERGVDVMLVGVVGVGVVVGPEGLVEGEGLLLVLSPARLGLVGGEDGGGQLGLVGAGVHGDETRRLLVQFYDT
ncbi:hypothetical protein Tdes44962_MAKER08265, partial [Teratosphaeria destructans]